jgi:hypothetical protein
MVAGICAGRLGDSILNFFHRLFWIYDFCMDAFNGIIAARCSRHHFLMEYQLAMDRCK